jgi:hypothetical protein
MYILDYRKQARVDKRMFARKHKVYVGQEIGVLHARMHAPLNCVSCKKFNNLWPKKKIKTIFLTMPVLLVKLNLHDSLYLHDFIKM